MRFQNAPPIGPKLIKLGRFHPATFDFIFDSFKNNFNIMKVVHSKLREEIEDKPKKHIPLKKNKVFMAQLYEQVVRDENAKIRARQNKQQWVIENPNVKLFQSP